MKTVSFIRLALVLMGAVFFLTACDLNEKSNAPKLGTVNIASTPKGAALLINGIMQKEVTPCTLRLPVDSPLLITLRAPGFRRSDAVVTPRENRVVTHAVNLAPVSNFVIIKTDPAGAAVTFDNRPCGLSPCVLRDVAPGTYKVSAKSPIAIAPIERVITVEDGKPAWITIPIPSIVGRLRLSAVFPEDVVTSGMAPRAYISGRQEAYSLPYDDELPEGTYTITGKCAGFHDVVTTITLKRDVTSEHTLFFKEKSGRFQITTVPEGATISIDGNIVGKAPLLSDEFLPGEHTITAELPPNYEPLTQNFVLQRGNEAFPVELTLSRLTGDITLTNVIPAGAIVNVDGMSQCVVQTDTANPSRTLPVVIKDLQPGEHRIEITHPRASKKGKKRNTATIGVSSDETTTYAGALEVWVPDFELTLSNGSKQTGRLREEIKSNGEIRLECEPGWTTTFKKGDYKQYRNLPTDE